MLSVEWRDLPLKHTFLRLCTDPSSKDADGVVAWRFTDLGLDPNDTFLDLFNFLDFALILAVKNHQHILLAGYSRSNF